MRMFADSIMLVQRKGSAIINSSLLCVHKCRSKRAQQERKVWDMEQDGEEVIGNVTTGARNGVVF